MKRIKKPMHKGTFFENLEKVHMHISNIALDYYNSAGYFYPIAALLSQVHIVSFMDGVNINCVLADKMQAKDEGEKACFLS